MRAVDSGGRAALLLRARRLEYFTLVWNTLEALASLAAGMVAGSIALVGFGLDSVIENGSAVTLLWRLRAANEATLRQRQRAEIRSLRIIGVLFLLLAAYIAVDSGAMLVRRVAPERSLVGMIVAAASVVVMPLLGRAKRKTALELASGALRADSRQSDFCAYMAGITLAGLVLNAVLGWWWADPVAGLLMTAIITREGLSAVRGRACECGGSAVDRCCSDGEDGISRVSDAEEKWRKSS
jgi:divalent metal cation (Fe/Co/Zn/Cd) transporter